ncbi:MAG: 2-succinyl-6-hydroxy-2,4-cyclohexadiene-1-carboxylate synthase [Chloroflexi bacterium]|nr:2-succinyl-6-hydroxy-2,4-cyclohexadiene-1-carboxylate synthase [Chloroflexota bacterium]
MTFLQVNGQSYFYECSGEGRPLLLLHGFTGSSQNWRPLVPQLATQFQVVTLDLLGHGRTASPPEESRYTIDNAAIDLIAILDTLQIEQVHLLGYSMGGRLALFTAVTYPNRIHSLVLESAAPGLAEAAARQERSQRDRELADWIEMNGIQSFVERWQNLPLWESQKQLSVEVRQALHTQRLQNNPMGLANSLRGMGSGAQPSLWEYLPELTIPVLLIAGELDTKFVSINQKMAANLANARLEIVAGAGHTAHLERPYQFQLSMEGLDDDR